jgi:hypothetical protein
MEAPLKKDFGSRICLIVTYFGQFPPYMECVLRSCALNPSIQWLLVTDNHTDYHFPPNVRREFTTLDELRNKFSVVLGFPVSLPVSYKICDFRPAFGVLFQELLANFDFWGHCDLDQIFGDLRRFLRQDVLETHDRIFTRGHLSLYRNTDKVNNYFRLNAPNIRSFQEVFTDPVHRQFDEWRGIYPILRYHGIPQHHEEVAIDLVRPTRWRYTRFEGYETPNYLHQVFYWHKGKLFQAYRLPENAILDREFAYIHLAMRKLPAPSFDPSQSDGFLIAPNGFFPYNREYLTVEDFQRFNASRMRPWREILATFSHRFRSL